MIQGRYVTENFDTYMIPGIGDIPTNMHVKAMEELCEGDSYTDEGGLVK